MAEKVFAIAQLLEIILLDLTTKQITLAQQVSQRWRATIQASNCLKPALFLLPCPPADRPKDSSSLIGSRWMWPKFRDAGYPGWFAMHPGFQAAMVHRCRIYYSNLGCVGPKDAYIFQPPAVTMVVKVYVDGPRSGARSVELEADETIGSLLEKAKKAVDVPWAKCVRVKYVRVRGWDWNNSKLE